MNLFYKMALVAFVIGLMSSINAIAADIAGTPSMTSKNGKKSTELYSSSSKHSQEILHQQDAK